MKLELDVSKELGSLMKAMRVQSGLTQDDIAKTIGVSRPQIANMESARSCNIYLHHLVRCADKCGFEAKLTVCKLRKKK